MTHLLCDCFMTGTTGLLHARQIGYFYLLVVRNENRSRNNNSNIKIRGEDKPITP